MKNNNNKTHKCTLSFFLYHKGGLIVAIIKKPMCMLIMILALALGIRLAGINHGFPYIYHPDEPAVVRSALGIRFDPNPHHFDWPHLYFYLNYFIYMIFAKFRDFITHLNLKPQLLLAFPIFYDDSLVFYLISRIFSAVLGALTVIPFFLWTKKLVDQKSAFLATTLLALAPLHVRNSHYALIDVPMMFFLSWSLYFSTRNIPIAGLFLGLSASTKYHGALGGLFIFLQLFFDKTKSVKKRLLNMLALGIFTFLGFVLGTPFSVLDFKTFIRSDTPQGALWQFTNVGKVSATQHLEQLFDALTNKLPENLGYGAFLVFALETVLLIYKIARGGIKTANKNVFLSAVVFYILVFYISSFDKNRSHYYMITYPFFFLTAGWSMQQLLNTIKCKFLKLFFVCSVLAISLAMSIYNIGDLISKTSTKIYGGHNLIEVK